MITYHFPENTTPKVKFALSPLFELSISCYTLFSRKPLDPILEVWRTQSLQALDGADLPYLMALVGSGYVADFLTPTPTESMPSFADDLAELYNTPEAIIREDVQRVIRFDGTSEIRQQYLDFPRESLECLMEELHFVWQRAIEPYWHKVVAVVEGDVLYRAKKQFFNGISGVFEDADPRIRFTPGKIEVDKRWDRELTLGDDGITLMPSFFANNHVFLQTIPRYKPLIVFSAWGKNRLKETSVMDERPLDTLIGETRALLLENLDRPASTGELALRLDVTSGAVSQHLAKLAQTGLVEAERSGQRVFYRLTERGRQLLSIFDVDKVGA